MLISMFLNHLLMLHRCYSHRHACTPSSLLQPDRSHTQPEYEYVTILEVVVIMGGEESRPKSFILCNYRATMEVSSSDEELIHQSTSEFDRCTVGKDRGFADAHPRQQRKNGSRHGHQECTSAPRSSAPKAKLQ